MLCRFAINLQYGPNTSPRDDIALHVTPRFNENYITRNSLQNMAWGVEENHGHMPLTRGQGFEIIILCEPTHYKVGIKENEFEIMCGLFCEIQCCCLTFRSDSILGVCVVLRLSQDSCSKLCQLFSVICIFGTID